MTGWWPSARLLRGILISATVAVVVVPLLPAASAGPRRVDAPNRPSGPIAVTAGPVTPVACTPTAALYAVAPTGELVWARQSGALSGGSVDITATISRGPGWDRIGTAFSGGDGVIFAVDRDGNLRWWRHGDPVGGAATWADGSGNVVSRAPTWGGYQWVFSTGDGDLFGVDVAGILWRERYTGVRGEVAWAGSAPQRVGTGWTGYRQVFGTRGGAYTVDAGGNLGFRAYTGAWAALTGLSPGWETISRAFAAPGGVVYGVDISGNLRYFRYTGTGAVTGSRRAVWSAASNRVLLSADTWRQPVTAFADIGTTSSCGAGPAVTLTRFPLTHQVVPRDATNTAVVGVRGTVTAPGVSGVRLVVLRDNVVTTTVNARISGTAPDFAFAPTIDAEQVGYTFRLYAEGPGAGSTLQWSAYDVVAGDVLVVSGQSNAAAQKQVAVDPDTPANPANTSAADRSPWVRTFGSPTEVPDRSLSDNGWYLADGDAYHTSGAVGQFALRLARRVADGAKVPVAVLNGAHDGQAVMFFQRRPAGPDDATSNYGRLLGRAERAGVAARIKAIFWYQGESDLGDAAAQSTGFRSLLDGWRTDFPTARVYVHQIRNGCLPHPVYEEQEAQRRYSDLPGVEVLSTNGIDGQSPGACHYFYERGYRRLADNGYLALARDLYGGAADGVSAPNPAGAVFADAGRTTVTVRLRVPGDPLVADGSAYRDFVVRGPGGSARVTVTGVSTRPGAITLRLSGPAPAGSTVSYLGHDGPGRWITTSRGVALLTFYGLPIG